MTPPPGRPVPALEGAAAGRTLPVGEVLEESALERLLARGRVRATLAMLGPAFVASIAYVDPGNFATNLQGGAEFGYLLLWVVLLGEPDGDADPVPLGQARDRHRPQLPRGRARALPARVHLGHVDPGRDHGDVDRHRRVPRRRDRPEPAVRRAAAPRRTDHRRDRVRDPRAADPRLPPLRARDQRAARHHLRRLPLRDAADRALRATARCTACSPACTARPRSTSRSGSSARP